MKIITNEKEINAGKNRNKKIKTMKRKIKKKIMKHSKDTVGRIHQTDRHSASEFSFPLVSGPLSSHEVDGVRKENHFGKDRQPCNAFNVFLVCKSFLFTFHHQCTVSLFLRESLVMANSRMKRKNRLSHLVKSLTYKTTESFPLLGHPGIR